MSGAHLSRIAHSSDHKLKFPSISFLYFLLQAKEVITTIKKEDEHKRFELKAFFEEVLKHLKTLDEQVVQHLVLEGTITESLTKDFEEHIQSLSNNECPILVAGETSIIGFGF